MSIRQLQSKSCIAFMLLLLGFTAVAAKDEWIRIKTKNFLLIGNAPESDIRRVANRLEQFRESFRLVIGFGNVQTNVPTNVVVFKDDGFYTNFKPRRSDGKIDQKIVGYFQPGDDVNYITLASKNAGDDFGNYNVIFHEYVHSVIDASFGRSDVPSWFNEGLAEYYSTFSIGADQKIKFGLPPARHVSLLNRNGLMPLEKLFQTTGSQLREMGEHSAGIFYAQSWALTHYLLQNGKSEALLKFVELLAKRSDAQEAFKIAFNSNYLQMESELKNYISGRSFKYREVNLKEKLVFDSEMEVSGIDDADSNAFLGDLLYHTNRWDEAEPYLGAALKAKPDSSLANTALGMVKIRQNKFAEARPFLEKAIKSDTKNHIAFYQYAFLLSREAADEYGFVREFDKDTASKIRNALEKAIALAPSFTESYEQLAYLYLVQQERLDTAVSLIQTALKYQPGNKRYTLRMAEVMSRQGKHVEAMDIAKKISETADDPDTKLAAVRVIGDLNERLAYEQRSAAIRQQYEREIARRTADGTPATIQLGKEVSKPPTEKEIARISEAMKLRSLNEALRIPGAGEKRVVGSITSIDCRTKPITFRVKSGPDVFTLTAGGFDSLNLRTFEDTARKLAIGCSTNLTSYNSVISFRPNSAPQINSRGELLSIEFVPPNFRFLSGDEIRDARFLIYEEQGPKSGSSAGEPAASGPNRSIPTDTEIEFRRRELLVKSINESLQKPAAGQKREMGFLEKIECSDRGMVFNIKAGTEVYRLRSPVPELIKVFYYTPDLATLRLDCQVKPVEYPVVFVFSDKRDAVTKTHGEVFSLEFVPKSFVLL